jgi:hypothetical protein
MTDPDQGIAYVFGYGSLVERQRPLRRDGIDYPAVPGRLPGFGRCWGVAMDNREAAPSKKHFADPGSGRAPRVRVAFLDLEERVGVAVNGLAIPVDVAGLAELDAREVNYERIEVTSIFQPHLPYRVFAYAGTSKARERCRLGSAGGEICVSVAYLATVRRAFSGLGEGALDEFERSTVPLPFPERELLMVQPSPSAEGTAGSPRAALSEPD